MDDAYQLVVILFIVSLLIYGIGLFTERNVLKDLLAQPAERLAPYGIQLFHLR